MATPMRRSSSRSSGGGRGGSHITSRLDELVGQQRRKLSYQKSLCEEANRIFTKEGGLNQHSLATMKNLEFAIAVAMRPGTIDYYKGDNSPIESGELHTLTRKILQAQKELEQLSDEVGRCRAKLKLEELDPNTLPVINSLSQWFSTYGEPKTAPSGYLTTYEEDRKVYGGTDHYRAFKTQATTMKKGRLTR